ncbi:MAG: phosphoribosylaminoimidazolesuccinocarboxamide synthase, partial [Clostridiales bacterium]|nr:phosphoribosylaminoimidazolesuccinocarboxamide synthase [Clostridiales bacterium]
MMIKDTSFIDLPVFIKGKVREVYDLGDSLLMVVTDRISAFDVVFDQLIPDKGKVLSSISAFWFDYTKDIIPNHVISTDPKDYPMGLDKYEEELKGRSMLVKKVDMLPAECIVRGYLEGSALKEYKANGTVGGIKMPEGMVQGDKLPEPLFTPSTKEETGHDINITFDQLKELLGDEDATALKDAALA